MRADLEAVSEWKLPVEELHQRDWSQIHVCVCKIEFLVYSDFCNTKQYYFHDYKLYILHIKFIPVCKNRL